MLFTGTIEGVEEKAIMEKIKLKITSPKGVLVSEKCQVISLVSTAGMIEIMPCHENMLIELKAGDIVYDREKKITIKSGFAKIIDGSCEIMVEQ